MVFQNVTFRTLGAEYAGHHEIRLLPCLSKFDVTFLRLCSNLQFPHERIFDGIFLDTEVVQGLRLGRMPKDLDQCGKVGAKSNAMMVSHGLPQGMASIVTCEITP